MHFLSVGLSTSFSFPVGKVRLNLPSPVWQHVEWLRTCYLFIPRSVFRGCSFLLGATWFVTPSEARGYLYITSCVFFFFFFNFIFVLSVQLPLYFFLCRCISSFLNVSLNFGNKTCSSFAILTSRLSDWLILLFYSFIFIGSWVKILLNCTLNEMSKLLTLVCAQVASKYVSSLLFSTHLTFIL